MKYASLTTQFQCANDFDVNEIKRCPWSKNGWHATANELSLVCTSLLCREDSLLISPFQHLFNVFNTTFVIETSP